MIVELIGCAGAGKSTLARMLCDRGIARSPVVLMPDLVRDRVLIRRITHPTAVNLVQEIGGLPFFVRSWRESRGFVTFARDMLGRGALPTLEELNGMRGIVRKVGMYHRAARTAGGAVVVSDEGTVLSAYNLFVTTNADLGLPAIENFARLVPRPDRAVYVRAPVAALVGRALTRPTPRRQHRRKGVRAIERDIRRTVELFDLVAATEPLRDRTLVVDNDDGDEATRRCVVDEIAAWLEASMSVDPRATGAPRPLVLEATA